jgi:hypothetical protein
MKLLEYVPGEIAERLVTLAHRIADPAQRLSAWDHGPEDGYAYADLIGPALITTAAELVRRIAPTTCCGCWTARQSWTRRPYGNYTTSPGEARPPATPYGYCSHSLYTHRWSHCWPKRLTWWRPSNMNGRGLRGVGAARGRRPTARPSRP